MAKLEVLTFVDSRIYDSAWYIPDILKLYVKLKESLMYSCICFILLCNKLQKVSWNKTVSMEILHNLAGSSAQGLKRLKSWCWLSVSLSGNPTREISTSKLP